MSLRIPVPAVLTLLAVFACSDPEGPVGPSSPAVSKTATTVDTVTIINISINGNLVLDGVSMSDATTGEGGVVSVADTVQIPVGEAVFVLAFRTGYTSSADCRFQGDTCDYTSDWIVGDSVIGLYRLTYRYREGNYADSVSEYVPFGEYYEDEAERGETVPTYSIRDGALTINDPDDVVGSTYLTLFLSDVP